MIQNWIRHLQHYANRIWYPPLIGLLAFLDCFIVIVPTDGILISSAMLTPKRWVVFALHVAIGSTIGAVSLALLVEVMGLPWVLQYYPGIDQTEIWMLTQNFFDRYGLLVVFGISATPLMQQPMLILAGLASTKLVPLLAAVFLGRLMKFMIMAYAGARGPGLVRKMWGVKSELKRVGIKLDN